MDIKKTFFHSGDVASKTISIALSTEFNDPTDTDVSVQHINQGAQAVNSQWHTDYEELSVSKDDCTVWGARFFFGKGFGQVYQAVFVSLPTTAEINGLKKALKTLGYNEKEK